MRLLLLLMGITLHAHSAEMSLRERFGQAVRYLSKGSEYYNPKEARKLLAINAEHEHKESMLRLSKLCLYGEGGALDYSKGIELLERLVKLDIAIAYFELGQCYQQGLGVEKDQEKAKDYFTIAYQKDPGLAERYRHDKEADNFKHIKNPLEVILQEARKGRAQGSTEASQRALKHYQDYVQFADTHGFKKDPQALIEHARLLLYCGVHDATTKATSLLEEAMQTGSQEAALELAKHKIKENTKAGYEQAKDILLKLAKHEKIDRLLAMCYLRHPFTLDEQRATQVHRGLHALHKEGNYEAVKELFIWSLNKKPGVSANQNPPLSYLEILHKKGQYQLILDLAVHLEQENNFTLAHACLMKLVLDGTPNTIKKLAFLRLAYGLGKFHFVTSDTKSAVLWLLEAAQRHGEDFEPKLQDHELAAVLCEFAVRIFDTNRSNVDTAISLLEHAIPLKDLNAARLKYDFLLTAQRTAQAQTFLDTYIPPPEVKNFQQLLYDGALPHDEINDYLARMALLTCQIKRPDQPQGDQALYGHYLSYAGMSHKKRAWVNLGTCLLFGALGFEKHPDKGFLYLNKVLPSCKYYADAIVALGRYHLQEKDFDQAFATYLNLKTATKHIRIEILNQLHQASSALDQAERWAQSADLLELLITVAEKHSYQNDSVALARFNLAYLYYDKKTGLNHKEPQEIMSLCDQSGLAEALIIKTRILLEQQNFSQVLKVLELAKERIHKSSEYSLIGLLMFGYTNARLGHMAKAREYFNQTIKRKSLLGHFNKGIIDLLTDQKTLSTFSLVFTQEKENYETILSDTLVLNPFMFVHQKKLTYTQIALKIEAAVTVQAKNSPIILIQELKPLLAFSLECLKREEASVKNLADAQKIRDDIKNAKAMLERLTKDQDS